MTAVKTALDMSNVLTALAAGGAAGVGARTVKNLWDLYQDRDVRSAVAHRFPAPTAARAQVPVEVSPDEAKELEASGVHVKSAADPGFLGQFLMGAGATGAAALGWKGMDSYFDGQRLTLAKQKLQNARNRLQKLLAGSPAAEDAHFGTAMKTAEDAYIAQEKTAGALSFLNDLGGQLSPLGYLAGGGAALVAASAFNEARKRNKSLNNAKAISDFANAQPVQPPTAELVPVMHKQKIAALDQPTTNATTPVDWGVRLDKLKARRGELKGQLDGRPA